MTIKTEMRMGRKIYLVEIGKRCFGYFDKAKALAAIAVALDGKNVYGDSADTVEIEGWAV